MSHDVPGERLFDSSQLPEEAQVYIAGLEEKLTEAVDRQASSRDSIVALRRRVNQLLEQLNALERAMAEQRAISEAEVMGARMQCEELKVAHAAYVDGLLKAQREDLEVLMGRLND